MNRLRRIFAVFCALWLLGMPWRGRAAEAGAWRIEHQREDSVIEWEESANVVTARNGVTIHYGDSVLKAERATLNRESGWVTAEGEVQLQTRTELWRGDQLRYNFLTRAIDGADFRTGVGPFFAAGSGLSADVTNGVYTARGALVTTDDVRDPGYRVRAKELTIVPGRYIEARSATFYLGNVPVLYWPYWKRSLERHPNNWQLLPGYRSLYGAYLLTSYNWMMGTNSSAAMNFDYRQKRGWAVGPDVKYDLGRWGEGEFAGYLAFDEDPGFDPAKAPIRDDRHRIRFSHSANLRTNLTVKAVVGYQSDAQVIRDFFETEYRRNPQQATFLELNPLWPNFSLNVLAQPRVNEFFQTVERLPDVRLSAFRQQLGNSPIFYESESSAGYYRQRFAPGVGTDYEAFRGDSYHQLTLPRTFFGWLNVSPRVGGRFTYYGEVDGLGTTFDAQTRGIFNTGAEVSTRASKVWASAQNRMFDVRGLRHIVQPSVNYVYVPEPNRVPAQLPQFDPEFPTLRLLPVEFPDYNAIDSIDAQNVLRFSVRNKLQTKRDSEIDNVVNWALYTDWRLNPRAGQSTFADVYSDLDFRPRSWLTLTSELRYDVGNTRWLEANHVATVLPGDRWSWSVGHRYLRDDFTRHGQGNNLIMSSFYYRVNENWGTRISHHFEARDGTLEEQYYTIYRDLRSWTGALTFRVRENRTGPTDYTVAVTFSLKAFPRYRLGADRDTPSLLLGG